MVQRRQHRGLGAEPRHQLGVAREVGAEHLDRDLAPQPEILAAVDHAHRAARQLVQDPVGPAERGARRHAAADLEVLARLGLAAHRPRQHHRARARGAHRHPQPREPGLAGALAGAERGHRAAQRERDVAVGGGHRDRDPRRQLDRRDLGARGVEPGQEHREIVAAEPRDAIDRPRRALQPCGESLQHLVADAVAVLEVEPAHADHVEQRQRQRLAAAPGLGQRRRDLLLEGGAGQDAGQRIVTDGGQQPLVLGDQAPVAGAERQFARQPRRQRAQIRQLGRTEPPRAIGHHRDQPTDLARSRRQRRGDHAERPGSGRHGGDAGGGRDPGRGADQRLVRVGVEPGPPRHQALALAPPQDAVVGRERSRDDRQAVRRRLAHAVEHRRRDQAAGPGQLDLGQPDRRRRAHQGQRLGRHRRHDHAHRRAASGSARDLAGGVALAQHPARRGRGHPGQGLGRARRHQHRRRWQRRELFRRGHQRRGRADPRRHRHDLAQPPGGIEDHEA